MRRRAPTRRRLLLRLALRIGQGPGAGLGHVGGLADDLRRENLVLDFALFAPPLDELFVEARPGRRAGLGRRAHDAGHEGESTAGPVQPVRQAVAQGVAGLLPQGRPIDAVPPLDDALADGPQSVGDDLA